MYCRLPLLTLGWELEGGGAAFDMKHKRTLINTATSVHYYVIIKRCCQSSSHPVPKEKETKRVKNICVHVCRRMCKKQHIEKMRHDKERLRDFDKASRARRERVGCVWTKTRRTDPRLVSEQVNMQTNLMKSSGGWNTPTEVRAMHPGCD